MRKHVAFIRQTIIPMVVVVLLTGGTVWATPALQTPPSAPIEVQAGSSVALHAEHGFAGQNISNGQKDVTLAALSVIEGVPRCTDHNATTWHPLVKKDAAGAITCTYGHEHHQDPNSVNDVFGAPGAWFGASGQSISYPWQTFSTLGVENSVKHEGYKWYAEKNMECKKVGGQPGCLRAWRVQVHSMGHASDAVARFHSYSFEGLVEYTPTSGPVQTGIVRHGGWMDFGHLALAAGGGAVCPPLTSNPETFTCGQNNHREPGARDVPSPYTNSDRSATGWYGNHFLTSLTTTIEDWGPISYTNPTSQLYYDPSLKLNNSKGNLGNMAISFFPAGIRDWQTPGQFSYDGYTDQHGKKVDGCTHPGPIPDSPVVCSTIKVENAPNVVTYWNSTTQGMAPPIEHDVLSPVTGKSLIVFPN